MVFLVLGFCHEKVSVLDGGGCLDRVEDEVCIGEGGLLEIMPSFVARALLPEMSKI